MEETKEEYLARHRLERGMDELSTEPAEERPATFLDKLNGVFFMVLFGLFFLAVLFIFGMLKGN